MLRLEGHLGDDDEPGVDGHVAKALLQCGSYVGRGAVAEPQRQQAQDVLQARAPRALTCRAGHPVRQYRAQS